MNIIEVIKATNVVVSAITEAINSKDSHDVISILPILMQIQAAGDELVEKVVKPMAERLERGLPMEPEEKSEEEHAGIFVKPSSTKS